MSGWRREGDSLKNGIFSVIALKISTPTTVNKLSTLLRGPACRGVKNRNLSLEDLLPTRVTPARQRGTSGPTCRTHQGGESIVPGVDDSGIQLEALWALRLRLHTSGVFLTPTYRGTRKTPIPQRSRRDVQGRGDVAHEPILPVPVNGWRRPQSYRLL